MWLTDSSGELFPSPTVMAVSRSRGDGVNTTTSTSWFFFSLLHAGLCLLPSEISQTSHRLLCFQPWPIAALICRLCLKRSGTSWRSWIWSCPRVRSPHSGFNSWSCGGDTCRPSLSVDHEGVYMKTVTDSRPVSAGRDPVRLQWIRARLQQMIKTHWPPLQAVISLPLMFVACMPHRLEHLHRLHHTR